MSLETSTVNAPPMDVTFRARVEKLYVSYGLDGCGAWAFDLLGVIEASNNALFEPGMRIDMGLHELVDGESSGAYLGQASVGINEDILPEHGYELIDLMRAHHADPDTAVYVDIRCDRPMGTPGANIKWGLDGYDFLLRKVEP